MCGSVAAVSHLFTNGKPFLVCSCSHRSVPELIKKSELLYRSLQQCSALCPLFLNSKLWRFWWQIICSCFALIRSVLTGTWKTCNIYLNTWKKVMNYFLRYWNSCSLTKWSYLVCRGRMAIQRVNLHFRVGPLLCFSSECSKESTHIQKLYQHVFIMKM